MEKQFVENRLVEKFDRADVVEYLSNRPTNYESWAEDWLRIASQLFPSRDGKEYEKLITKFEEPLKSSGIGGGPIYNFVTYLCQREEVKVYSLYPNYLVKWDDQYCVIGSRRNNDGSLKATDVVETLLKRWIDPKMEAKYPDSYKDKPHGARELLIERLQELVEGEIRRACDDFRRACAVSPDGRKIIIANRVIVVRENDALVFHADLFSERKIERPAGMQRIEGWTTREVQNAINTVRVNVSAVFVKACGVKWNDDFIVHEKFVPQPLPLPFERFGEIVLDIL